MMVNVWADGTAVERDYDLAALMAVEWGLNLAALKVAWMDVAWAEHLGIL